MFSGHHLMLKRPGSKVITWSWKQKLVGVSMTGGFSWQIMKKSKSRQVSKTHKNNNFITYLSLFRILVSFPNFEIALTPKRRRLVRTFFKLKYGLGQVVVPLKKSPSKSNSFRRESISKLPGGKPMNVFTFGLWSSYQTWQLWNALTPKRVGLVPTFLKLKNGIGQVVIQLKKGPQKSNSPRRESISKLPGGIALYVNR